MLFRSDLGHEVKPRRGRDPQDNLHQGKQKKKKPEGHTGRGRTVQKEDACDHADDGPLHHPEADHPERNGYCCPEAVVFPEVDPADQRQTGDPPEACEREAYERDCGRGLYILHHIFDQVEWSPDGKELMLYKRTNRWFFPSLFWNS